MSCQDCESHEREHVSVFTREVGSCTVCPKQLPSMYQDVRAFQREMGLVLRDRPGTLSAEDWQRRVRLIHEELAELSTAQAARDLPEFADALADLVWVVLGTAAEAGIPFDAVWREVRRSNMAKKGGTLDASGKFLKPAGWSPPDIKAVLMHA